MRQGLRCQIPSGKAHCSGFHHTPAPHPESSNFTPDTCSAKLSGAVMEKRKLLQLNSSGVGLSCEKGECFRHKTQRTHPGCGRGKQCLQSTRPKGTAAPAHLLRKAPQPQSPGDRTLTEAGDHQPAGRATTFLSPPLLVPEWPKTPLPASPLRTALTPLRPRTA